MEKTERAPVLRTLPRMVITPLASIYLIVLVMIPETLSTFLPVTSVAAGVSFAFVVAVILDILDEFAFEKAHGNGVKWVEFHSVEQAQLAQAALEQASIPHLIKGYHHRSLLHLLGPFIEMPCFVPEDHLAKAMASLQDLIAHPGSTVAVQAITE